MFMALSLHYMEYLCASVILGNRVLMNAFSSFFFPSPRLFGILLCSIYRASNHKMEIGRIKSIVCTCANQINRSFQPINPTDQSNRSIPSIYPIDQSNRSIPLIYPIDLYHRSIPLIYPIDLSHWSIPSINTIDLSNERGLRKSGRKQTLGTRGGIRREVGSATRLADLGRALLHTHTQEHTPSMSH